MLIASLTRQRVRLRIMVTPTATHASLCPSGRSDPSALTSSTASPMAALSRTMPEIARALAALTATNAYGKYNRCARRPATRLWHSVSG